MRNEEFDFVAALQQEIGGREAFRRAVSNTALSNPPPEERWMMAISGGVQEREGALVEGPPDKLADPLVRYLQRGLCIQQ